MFAMSPQRKRDDTVALTLIQTDTAFRLLKKAERWLAPDMV
jgi:hypothetical protein